MRNRLRSRFVAWLLILDLFALLAIGGCRSQAPADCVCTTVHAMITFAVVDDTNTPMPGFAVQSRIQRTNELLQVKQDLADQGIYVVATDSNLSQIRPSGETLLVEGTLGQTTFSGTIVVNAPGTECICHIAKVSGPDTVMIGRAGP